MRSAAPRSRAGASALAILLATRAAALESPAPLSLKDAVAMAVRHHVTLRLARARDDAERGQVLAAAAALLPRLTGSASEVRVFRVNLAAEGFGAIPLPISPLIGPFDVFDARGQLSLAILDPAGWSRFASARARARAADLEVAAAEEQVASAVALAYVEALRSRASIGAAGAGANLAENLLALAHGQRQTGTVAGLDVARAETRRAEERLRLIEANADANEANLRLARLLGLPLARPLALTDSLTVTAEAAPTAEEAVTRALAARPELGVLRARLDAARDGLTAARRECWPSLVAAGDYGLSGNVPDGTARATGSAGLAVRWPLFAGGEATAHVREARAELDAAQARLDDALLGVEEDARRAVDRLAASRERVAASGLAVALAARELEMAKDRFATGVGDNVELVNAQTVLARTQDDDATALAKLAVARLNLALALARMTDFGL